jgi:hypothetical protein
MDSLPFDPEPPSDEEVACLRREFEAGDFFALNEVFFRLAVWGRPLPEWVFVAVNKALEGAWVRNAGSKGQKTGGYRTKTRSFMLHFVRHGIAEKHLATRGNKEGPQNREEAFERARAELASNDGLRPYRGSRLAIEKSYDLIQGALRPRG